ncbi:MAG: Adaptive-response sensory-kinase SasA [Chroococcopsis gigantea SAG 12.99]|jgi:signal transduction histidine kinase|nr:response regulator [Chlorogloea purpurea SAG 13.99]MDV2999923.1 Adaptive-response sensory-kinase SasA [Chroococcopsis gigantea SAG 12.99]
MQAEPKVNILLVDDNPKNLLTLEAILSKLDQNLVQAYSGEDALRCLLNRDFALILLDVMMPGMDGFETAALIRSRERSRDVPIIFITAYSHNEQQTFQGYCLGAVDYLVKPIDPGVLLCKVSVFVELHKKTAKIIEQAAHIATLNAELEYRVQQRTAELAATNATLEKRNQELDQFVYVASHDLKSPLRAIANIATWLGEDLQDKLTHETAYQLNILQGRVHRMEKLIDGLLLYYRVGRRKMKSEKVAVGQLLLEVIDCLAPDDRFLISIAPDLPTLRTVRILLEQVFTNLIGNAIKHHHPAGGKIEINARREGDYYEFSVGDDGPGIDPQFHDRVFSLFQTLEPHASDNTGIGLTIVKKIVETEGGKISMDSGEGKGTIVYFTWPVN